MVKMKMKKRYQYGATGFESDFGGISSRKSELIVNVSSQDFFCFSSDVNSVFLTQLLFNGRRLAIVRNKDSQA